MPGADKEIIYAIRMEAKSLRNAIRNLGDFKNRAIKDFQQVDRQAAKTGKGFGALRTAILPLLSAYGAFRGIKAFVRLSDEATNLTNQIKSATRETGQFMEVNEALRSIAKSTFAPLNTTVNLYREISRLRPELGQTLEQEKQFVTAINQAAAISGASTEAIGNSLRQLSQGLAGGVLRAEEWNAIVENTPEIASQIGKGLGTTIGQLRQMVIEGEVFSEDVLGAILKQAPKIDEEFGKLTRTIGQETESLKTSTLDLVDVINEEFGVAGSIAKTISGLRGLLEEFTKDLKEYAQARDKVALIEGIGVSGNSNNAFGINRGGLTQKQAEDVLASDQRLLGRLPKQAPEETPQTIAADDALNEEAKQKRLEDERKFAKEKSQLINQLEGESIARRLEDQLGQISDAQMEEIRLYGETEEQKQAIRERYDELRSTARQKAAKEEAKLAQETTQLQLQSYQSIANNFAATAQIFSKGSESAFNTYKAFASASAGIGAALAIIQALGDPTVPPTALKIAQSVFIGALAAAQIAQIQSQTYTPARQYGGFVNPGQRVKVGEAGAELYESEGESFLVGGRNPGRIIPNHKLGGGGQPISITINAVEGLEVNQARNGNNINIDILGNQLAELITEGEDNALTAAIGDVASRTG